jgi:hypothetical protein
MNRIIIGVVNLHGYYFIAYMIQIKNRRRLKYWIGYGILQNVKVIVNSKIHYSG